MTAMLLVSSAPLLPLSAIPAAFSFDVARIASSWTPGDFTRPHPPPPASSIARKRPRAVADVDGDSVSSRPKKRRLRLHLITSRLSQPFAAPSTYINSRGAFIAARLAFQRRVGRSLLRKAAIENWMRVRRGMPAPLHPAPSAIELTSGLEGWIDEPRPPSEAVPWDAIDRGSLEAISRDVVLTGLSNYNAIDQEDSPFDEDSWSDSQEDMEVDVYSTRPPDEILTDAVGAMFQGSKRGWAIGDPIQSNPYWAVLSEEGRASEVPVGIMNKQPGI